MKEDPPALRTHGRASLAAFVLILALAFGTFLAQDRSARGMGGAAEMGIEHQSPMALQIEMSARDSWSIVEIAQESAETVGLSVPTAWERREVRGAALEAVVAEESALGFRRWRLPPGVTVSFRAPSLIETLRLHNPSGVPVKVELTRVDLAENTAERDVILVKDAPIDLLRNGQLIMNN